VRSWFAQPRIGSCETAAAPFWRLLPRFAPDVFIVTIRRPVDEVLHSLARQGFDVANPAFVRRIRQLDRKLDQIEQRVPGVLSIPYKSLESESVCADLFESCLPYRHDSVWWQHMQTLNLQIDMPRMVNYCHAYAPQLEKMAATAKRACLIDMTPPSPREEGLVIQQESLQVLHREGRHLFHAHSLAVGEHPESYLQKNIAIMELLEQQDSLQITTARCNGKMFGYLMTIISPSLERCDSTTGIHTLFYCDPSFKGLGMKLQRASIEALRNKGVGEVIFRAGTRGSAERVSVLYRRLGGEDFGQLYRLDLSKY
jgi:hypothetical protein